MLDDTDRETPRDQLTPKPPEPICTVMSDGSIQVIGRLSLVDLNNLMLSALSLMTARTVERAAATEQVLATVYRRWEGFDPATSQMIEAVLGITPPADALPPLAAEPPAPAQR